jgi:hypothetical protein
MAAAPANVNPWHIRTYDNKKLGIFSNLVFRWTHGKCELSSPSAFYLAFYRMKKTFPQCERFDVSYYSV